MCTIALIQQLQQAQNQLLTRIAASRAPAAPEPPALLKQISQKAGQRKGAKHAAGEEAAATAAAPPGGEKSPAISYLSPPALIREALTPPR